MSFQSPWNDLEAWRHYSWRLVHKAAKTRKGPLRTPALATADLGTSFMRTVILRDVSLDRDELIIFTDARSTKVAQLEKNKKSSLLFYEYVKNLQLRVNGEITVHVADPVADKYWKTVPPSSRFNYASALAPGSLLEEPGDGLDPSWRKQDSVPDTEPAFENFAVLLFQARELELLHLHPEGHRRAAFSRKANGEWLGRWLVP
jgi:pyridoxine/pyridoxamine 5'-phosphate oxidase